MGVTAQDWKVKWGLHVWGLGWTGGLGLRVEGLRGLGFMGFGFMVYGSGRRTGILGE